MDVFDKLDPKLQRLIYERLGWRDLRPMQKAVISALLTGKGDLLVSAPTAAGKTEAAFLPLISKCLAEPKPGLRILCISPLKALMNNQEARIKRLCPEDTLPVTIWHSDASASGKDKLRKNPDGILLITPESLEAILDGAASHPEQLFAGTEFVVIDEIHALAGTTRGTHILSLLRRLELMLGRKLDTIGLSATMSNPRDCAAWLRPNDPNRVLVIADDGAGTITGSRGEDSRILRSLKTQDAGPSLRGCIYAWDFEKRDNDEDEEDGEYEDEFLAEEDVQATSVDSNSPSNSDSNSNKMALYNGPLPKEREQIYRLLLEELDAQKTIDASRLKTELFDIDGFIETYKGVYRKVEVEYAAEILRVARNKKILAFVNSRDFLESIYGLFAALKKARYDFRGLSVVRHHGLMESSEREYTEKFLAGAKSNVLVLCTSTLELGIDIGDVDEVFFLNAPFSVSSFMQRLGRSGRRQGQVPTFRFFLACRNYSLGKNRGERDSLNGILYPELVRAISLVRLALNRRIEPLSGLFPDVSTFVQQILSFIAAKRMTTLPAIFNTIGREAFANYFSKNDFIAVMTNLCKGEKPLVAQDANGMVHLTKQGEFFCEDREFYCSFASERTIELVSKGRVVGRLPLSAAPDLAQGVIIQLGAKLWRILDYTQGTKAEVEAIFATTEEVIQVNVSSSGGAAASGELGWELGLVLADNQEAPYITPNAQELLAIASSNAWYTEEQNEVLFVWASSRVQTTIFLLLKHLFPDESFVRTNLYIRSRSIEKSCRGNLVMDLTPVGIMLDALCDVELTEETLLKAIASMPVQARRMHKFDDLAPQYLVDKEFVRRCLDLEGTIQYLKMVTEAQATEANFEL